jgi:hypothetical protein
MHDRLTECKTVGAELAMLQRPLVLMAVMVIQSTLRANALR